YISTPSLHDALPIFTSYQRRANAVVLGVDLLSQPAHKLAVSVPGHFDADDPVNRGIVIRDLTGNGSAARGRRALQPRGGLRHTGVEYVAQTGHNAGIRLFKSNADTLRKRCADQLSRLFRWAMDVSCCTHGRNRLRHDRRSSRIEESGLRIHTVNHALNTLHTDSPHLVLDFSQL